MKLKRRTKIIIGLLLLLVFLAALFQVPIGNWIGRPIYISKATTFLTQPVRGDGGIDYAAALNQQMSKGVTPANNALVGLAQALECEMGYSGEYYQRLCQRLGVADLRPIKPLKYMEDHVINQIEGSLSDEEKEKIYDQYYLLMRAPWNPDQFPMWKQAMDAQNDALDLIVDAAQRSHYFHPVVGDLDGEVEALSLDLIPYVSQIRGAARILSTRVMLSLATKDTHKAIEDTKAIRRLGRLMGRSGDFIHLLVCAAVFDMAKHCEQQLMASGQLSREQLDQYQDFLCEPSKLVDAASRYDGYVRLALLDVVQNFAFYGKDPAWDLDEVADYSASSANVAYLIKSSAAWVDWNSTLAEANRLIDELVEAHAQPNDYLLLQKANETLSRHADMIENAETTRATLLALVGGPKSRGRMMGRFLYSVTGPGWPAEVEVRVKTLRDIAQVGVALQRFRVDRGQYPDSLDQLSPRYIDVIPLDRFSNAPLIYKRRVDGYDLYSVSKNQQDDGGIDWAEATDHRHDNVFSVDWSPSGNHSSSD